jgi:hypothetical protein
MKEVGGYEQVMKLPIITYNLLAENIIAERKAQIKSYKIHSKH